MKKVSFCIPCYKSEQTLAKVVDEIRTSMEELSDKYEYEIILVNDASPDGTFNVICKLADTYPNITGIDLAKNFGQHAALMAGFAHLSGDILVCLDDDGQTPANEVYKLLDKIEEGEDVVYAKYDHKKHSLFRNFGSFINEKMTEFLLGKPKELYVSSYFAAKRFIVDEMLRYDKSYPYVIGLVLRSTKRIANVNVDHREREVGRSGYTLGKLLGLWMNGFTAFSVKPLRIATWTGISCAILGFIYGLYTIIKKFVLGDAVAVGFSALMSSVMFIGGMILFMLGILGEYIGRMYISMNNAPQYVIREVVKKH
ncbi:MAG: glycosyltransferase family 2 protein [Lachnospiraceae bacterium]|nr:glycosyltransferase family 2 protein [Lachnospiraceae bacterium]